MEKPQEGTGWRAAGKLENSIETSSPSKLGGKDWEGTKFCSVSIIEDTENV